MLSGKLPNGTRKFTGQQYFFPTSKVTKEAEILQEGFSLIFIIRKTFTGQEYSKISNLTQGMFVGAVSDNFDERIEQKIFHAEIVVDSAKVSAEMKAYQPIPIIAEFTNEDGFDNLRETIEANYKCVKQDILTLVASEMELIKNDPNLKGLIKE